MNRITEFNKAQADLMDGISKTSLWWALAWQDIKARYRRSLLGPLWITASTAVLVCAMGPLYGALLGRDISSYLQHLAVSLIIWSFMSGIITEAGTAFIAAEGYIKQVALPLSIHIFRMVAKNLVVLAHNAVIIVILLFFLPPAHWGSIWLLPLGLALVLGNLLWLSLLLAVVSTRFRDMPQLVANIVLAAFFLTPIIWNSDMLSREHRFVADYNPLYHFMEVIRAPLLGQPIQVLSWYVMCALLLIGSVGTFVLFARYRARVPYWL